MATTPERAATEMQAIARAMRALAEIPAKASPQAARELSKLIQEMFVRGVDPYGRPWKPIKDSTIRRKGHAQINVDSHNLKDTLQVRPLPGAGVTVIFGPSYAVYVQRIRPLLPKGPIPKAWGEAIRNAITSAATKSLREAGGEGTL